MFLLETCVLSHVDARSNADYLRRAHARLAELDSAYSMEMKVSKCINSRKVSLADRFCADATFRDGIGRPPRLISSAMLMKSSLIELVSMGLRKQQKQRRKPLLRKRNISPKAKLNKERINPGLKQIEGHRHFS